MLMCRRHEKDYLLRGDSSYQNRLNGEVENFLNVLRDAQSSEQEKGLLDRRITAYRRSFDRVVEIDRRIGFSDDQGLKGDIRAVVRQLEPMISFLVN